MRIICGKRFSLLRMASLTGMFLFMFATVFVASPAHAQYRTLLTFPDPEVSSIIHFNDTLYGLPGMLYSTDRGERWSPYSCRIDWDLHTCHSAAGNDSLLLILTSRGLFSKSRREGVFRWISSRTGQQLHMTGSIVHFTDVREDTTVLAFSTSNGLDARAYAHPGKNAEILFCEDSSVWILADNKTLYHSTNLGKSWTPKLSGNGNSVRGLARYRDKLYCIPSIWQDRLLVSPDDDTWTPMALPFYTSNDTRLGTFNGQLHVWSPTLGIQRFDEALNRWIKIADGVRGMNRLTMEYGAFYSTGDGLFLYEPSRSAWRLLAERNPYSSDPLLFTTQSSFFISDDANKAIVMRREDNTWWSITKPKNLYFQNLAEIDNVLYSAYDTTFLHSVDGGIHWSQAGRLPVRCRFFGASNGKFVIVTMASYTDTAFVMHSDDHGTTWKREGGFIDDQGVTGMFLRDSRRLIRTRQNGPVDHWYYSGDEGGSWIELNSTLQAPIKLIVLTEQAIVAQTTYGLWKSVDHGASWEGIYIPFEDFSLRLAIPGGVCLTVPDGFVFVHMDNSAPRFLRFPLESASVNQLVSNGKELYFSGFRKFVIALELTPEVLSVLHSPVLTDDASFTAGGIWPMPVRDGGSIPVTAKYAMDVSVSIMDFLGRDVVDEYIVALQPGENILALPGKRLTPGIYFVRLSDGETVSIRRCIVK
ncbi:MAG: T9SS type A sorting domain-containing protein [Bacteroidia bacterium]|nr:T9SS type A sorting domain-containing protein [Bacteroidia bacterium]